MLGILPAAKMDRLLVASRPKQLIVKASLGQQQPRPSNGGRQRGSKAVSAGGTVNFVDVADQRDVWTVANDSIYIETQISQEQRFLARQLCAVLKVPTRVAVLVASQEPYLTGFATVSPETVRAVATHFGISCVTFGKVLTLRPDYIARPNLLQNKITQMSKLLNLQQPDFTQLLSRAPEMVAYSPEFLRMELRAVAATLSVDLYTAAFVVQQEPRILTDGAQQLSEKLTQLSRALNKGMQDIIDLVRTRPSLVYADIPRLEKKRRFLEETCSTHPCWLQQLSELPLLNLTVFMVESGVPVFMRFKYLAAKQQQPHVQLGHAMALSGSQFDLECPLFEAWAEWNTPSYLFE